jgi:hypothetical protein
VYLRSCVDGQHAEVGARESRAREIQRQKRHVGGLGIDRQVGRLLDTHKSFGVGGKREHREMRAAEARELLDKGLMDAPEERGFADDGQRIAASFLPGELRHLARLGLGVQAQHVEIGDGGNAAVRHVESKGRHHHRRALCECGHAVASERSDDNPCPRAERPDVGFHGLLRVVADGIDVHWQRSATLRPRGSEKAIPHGLGMLAKRRRAERQQ